MTQIPVIYHHGYILIALWRNRNASEIRFTVEHQSCQKLWSQVNIIKYCLIYWQFAPEEITAVIETRGARLWLICFFYHSVLIGTSSSGFIYFPVVVYMFKTHSCDHVLLDIKIMEQFVKILANVLTRILELICFRVRHN